MTLTRVQSRRVRRLSGALAVAIGLACGSVAIAQEPKPQGAAAPPAAATGAPEAPHGISAEQMAKSNNPLSDMSGINFHNYWTPTISGLPDDHSNTLNLRGIMVAGRQIIRATVPLTTAPLGAGAYASGIGDVSIFDAIRLTGAGSNTDFGVGPLLVIPSATDDALGQGKWQAGAAAVVIHPMGGNVLGALVTYQTDFAGDEERADTSLLTAQPLATISMSGGYYARSSAIWVFDLENDRYLIPFGIGIGRVFKGFGGIVNAFVEPQFTVYGKGDHQPGLQLFTGLMIQWPKKPKG